MSLNTISNGITCIGYPKKNIMDLLTKSLLIELVHNSLKRIDLQPLKIKRLIIIPLSSWLKIPRFRFKEKTKSYKILKHLEIN